MFKSTLKSRFSVNSDHRAWEEYAADLTREGGSLSEVTAKVTGIPAYRVAEIWVLIGSIGSEP
jgi:hypothetical protein